MTKKKKEYFDIEGIEGEEAEVEAVKDVAADLQAKMPDLTPSPENAVTEAKPAIVADLDLHATSAAAGAPYPTEEPEDPSVIWSPNPGVIGCKNQGYRKIRKI